MGRKQFEQVVAQASREKLRLFTYDVTTSVAAGSGEETLIYSSPGTIASVVGIRFFADIPPTGVSGNHFWNVGYKTGISNAVDVVLLSASFSSVAQFNYSGLANGTSLLPADGVNSMKGISFDGVTPLRIFYNNLTNVATGTARRFIFVTYIEREVRV